MSATPLIKVATSVWGSQPAIDVAQSMTHAVDSRTRELIAGFAHQYGPAPAEFTWVALGSNARGELHCASDQDHALVWATEQAATSTYAHDLADHVIAGLSEFGMRPCSGGYMADTWSMGLEQWAAYLHERIFSPTPDAIVDTDIFLDMRPVAGSLDVTRLADILGAGRQSARLMHGLAAAANSFPVPLNSVGRLDKGPLDVKRSGIAAIVLLARVYGLASGSRTVSTLGRLQASADSGVLGAQLAARLEFAYTLLTRIRFTQQLHQAHHDEPITDVVPLEAVTWSDQKLLRKAFKSIKSAQSITAVTYRTDL